MERTAGGRRHRAPRGRYLATTATFTILLMFAAAPARADVRDFLGRPLVDVRVEIGSVALADDSVLQLIETRIGDALSMQRVRETIDHLVGLGRFEDVRVFAESSATRPEGVVLR